MYGCTIYLLYFSSGIYHCGLSTHEISARDVLLSKREVLVKDIERIKYEEKELSKRKKELQNDLKRIEEQLKNIYSKQHEQIMLSKVSTDTNGHPKRLKAGSVGHIVHPQPDEGYGEFWYRGSSTYGGVNTGPDNPSDDESFYCQPPPPTKDQYEKYGIVSSHSSLLTAMNAANAGDCIYLLEGLHYEESSRHMNSTICVKKPLDFVGLGDANKVVVSVDHGAPFVAEAGPVSFVNMKFSTDMSLRPEGCEPHKWDHVPWFRHEDGPTTSKGLTIPIMCFGDESGSSKLGDYHVKDCIFDLGSTCERAEATRVSGILIKQGKSVSIEGCSFIGGAGSAIVAVNDPHLFTASIEITRNIFMNNGQPTFSEKPAAEMIPGPSSVEFWRFNRPLYQISESGTKEQWKTASLKFSNNQLSSNLRAPLAYRDVSPSGKETSDWQLYKNMPTGEQLQSLVPGFDLVVSENVFESNGLQFGKEAVLRMLGTTQTKEDEKDQALAKFPDGQSLLVIKHVLSYNDECSFPDGWGNGVPYLEYHEDYTYGHDYY